MEFASKFVNPFSKKYRKVNLQDRFNQNSFMYKLTFLLSAIALVLLPVDLFTYILSACAILSIVGMYHWFVMKVIDELWEAESREVDLKFALRGAEIQRDTYYAEIRALCKKLKPIERWRRSRAKSKG